MQYQMKFYSKSVNTKLCDFGLQKVAQWIFGFSMIQKHLQSYQNFKETYTWCRKSVWCLLFLLIAMPFGNSGDFIVRKMGHWVQWSFPVENLFYLLLPVCLLQSLQFYFSLCWMEGISKMKKWQNQLRWKKGALK